MNTTSRGLHMETQGSGPIYFHPGFNLYFKKVEELSRTELREAEFRCYPGHCSDTGFLEHNQHLKKCYEKDNQVLASAGISHREVAERLSQIFKKYNNEIKNLYKGNVTIKLDFGEYEVSHSIEPGSQFCPFSRFEYHIMCAANSVDYYVRKKGEQTVYQISSLIYHMILIHHFFEGEGCKYRLDPETAIKLLNFK
jgi:fido (protein-threonine AMPylation protein)